MLSKPLITTKHCLRGILACALWILSSADRISAQVPDWPAWANAPFPHFSNAEIASRTSAEWQRVPERLRPYVAWKCDTDLGNYAFASQSTSGTLAVWRYSSAHGSLPHRGVPTEFGEVLWMSTSAPHATWGNRQAVLWTGKRADGCYGLQGLALNAQGTLEIGSIWTFPHVSAQGEIWLAAGVVNDALYVVEATQKQLIRYILGASGWVIDSGFRVDLIEDRKLTPIYQILPHPDHLARLMMDPYGGNGPRGETLVLNDQADVAEGSSPYVIELVPSAYSPLSIVRPVSSIAAGATRLCLTGPYDHLVVVELWVPSSASWKKWSQPLRLAKAPSSTMVQLLGPLASGDRIRFRDDTANRTSEEAPVLAQQPMIHYVHDPLPKPIPAGQVVRIEGENLDQVVTAEVSQVPVSGATPLTIGARGPTWMEVTLPAQSMKGHLVLRAGSLSARHRISILGN